MTEKLKNYPMLIGVKHAKDFGLSRYQFNKLLQTEGISVKIGSKRYLDRDKWIEILKQQGEKK